MADDIVTRLRNETDDFHIFNLVIEAADEIELLRRALDLAVGELSTNDKYRLCHPEQLRQQFLNEAVRGD